MILSKKVKAQTKQALVGGAKDNGVDCVAAWFCLLWSVF